MPVLTLVQPGFVPRPAPASPREPRDYADAFHGFLLAMWFVVTVAVFAWHA